MPLIFQRSTPNLHHK